MKKRQPRKQQQQQTEERRQKALDDWQPITDLGRQVKMGEVTQINELLASKKTILEHQIVDMLVPKLENDLLMIGQSKGKFGGGAGRVFKQTQKKTREGNKPSFATCAIVGNKDGVVGMGYGKAKETVPAREKAFRNAKLNIIAIPRGSGDWESESTQPHTIPFKVTGQCGSIRMTLLPAPIGTGLVVEKECKKILELAGIKNIWAKTQGHTASKVNLIRACFDALKKLSDVRIRPQDYEKLHIVVGSVQSNQKIETEITEEQQ